MERATRALGQATWFGLSTHMTLAAAQAGGRSMPVLVLRVWWTVI